MTVESRLADVKPLPWVLIPCPACGERELARCVVQRGRENFVCMACGYLMCLSPADIQAHSCPCFYSTETLHVIQVVPACPHHDPRQVCLCWDWPVFERIVHGIRREGPPWFVRAEGDELNPACSLHGE